METVILIVILAVVIGGALWYIIREKKKGKKCIGCPHSSSCSAKSCATICGCGEKK